MSREEIFKKVIPTKRKKKKNGSNCSGASVSQLLAQRDRALAAAAAAEATHWSSRPPENAGFANPMNNQFQNIQLMKNQAHLQQKTFDTNSQGAHVMKLETPPARLADDKVAQFPCMNVINNSVREGAVLNVNGVSQLLPENNASGNELMRASQLNTTELPNQSQDIGQGMINHCAAAHPCGQEFVQNAVATPKPEGVMLNPQGMLYPPNVVMQRPRSIPPWHQAKMGINKKAVPEAPVVYEKVPFIQQSMPPPTATYEEVASRKKVKSISKGKKTSQEPSQPSFMENPSAYLAQQTALLHNTISRPNFNILADTRSATELPQNQQYPLSTSLGVAPCVVDNSSSLNVSSSMTIPSQRTSNLPVRPVVGHKIDQTNISQLQIGRRSVSEKETLITSGLNTGKDNFGDVTFNNHTCSNKNCADCKNSPLLATGVQNNIATSGQVRSDLKFIPKNVPKYQILGKGDWMGPEPGELVKAPISRNYDESNSNEDNPVTSSTENVPAAYNQKIISDLRPIQGGTISTSNGSPQPQPSPNSSNVFRQEISSPKQQELASQSPVTGNIQISSSNSYAGLSNGVGTRMGQEYDGIALRTFAMNSRSKREDTPSNQGLQSFANNGKTLFPEGDQRTKFVSHNVTVTTSSDQTSELNSECKGDQMKIQSVTSSLDERGEKQHNTCETKANRFVNTMATGHTNSSNTITSVQAGKTQTATVSVSNNSTGPPNALSLFNTFNQNLVNVQTAQKGNAKSPLEMVHNVVSNIQTTAEVAKNDVPLNAIPINKNVLTNSTSLSNVLTSTTNVNTTILANNNTNTTAMLKSSSGTLQAGHILVSSNGQYLVASNGNVLPQTNLSGLKLNQTPSMPPISAAPVITSNVTGAVTQVLPAVGVAQQVLGQSTVLVNALPTPFVIQPGVMAVETGLGRLAVATGNILQGNVIDNNALRNSIRGVVPTEKVKYKKGNKKRKNQVTSLVQMASPNNVILNQSFSPQNFTVSPGGNVQPLQAVTLVQGKHGQLVMNNQSNFNQFNNQPQQINLLQPVNLTSVPNFPAFQQFIVPGLGNMVMSADGTATILPDTNIGVQLQLQNVNGQNVLTPVQNTSFINSPGILTTPTGMFIRAPNNQQKIIQNNASPQFLSPNNNQFLVNQFQGQLSPLIAANLSPNQQLFASSPPRQSPQEFIQIIPPSSSQNTTVVQQNTTIVQQQTTMVSNNQNILNNSGKSNFILSNQSGEKPIEVQIVGGTHRQSQSSQPTVTTPIQQVNRSVAQEKVDFGTQHSVSTQTNVGEESVTNVGVATNNTFCQTLHSNWSGSPPDTTTHSPVELESNYERPHTPTEEGPDSLRQAMVQYVSSSINESENESDAYLISGSGKVVAPKENVSRTNKTKNFVESSTITQETGVQIQIGNSYMSGDYLKSTVDECVVSSHLDVSVQDKHIESQSNITRYQDDKISLVDALLAENKSGHLEEGAADSKEKLTKGDLVWGPVRGSPAWPGKLVGPVSPGGKALVRWFGGHSSPTKVNVSQLQSLSQGLEAHHRAFNKGRKNRRLNAALEAAIQEAMLELDKITAREKKIPGSGRGRPRRMHR
ncbi:hypothetical protein RUM43_000667 [Polyplax serrata]|uniref:PWWP domain-containing protein n=1 Tax=Polyplax serrata TaxID=468196 RepID=A0AAN8SCU7_POLSC